MPGIISGKSWLSERRRFLQEELAKDPDAELRAALEAELATVNQELGAAKRHWWRRLSGGSHPPG
jgi:hypothetical protein